MKERFTKRRLTGTINVTCKYDDGSTRMWSADKAEIVGHIVRIVEEYADDGYTLTLRQLHYQLVQANLIVNHTTAYKKLGDVLDDCRYAGLIDWDAIEDRGRKPYIPYSADSVMEALQHLYDYYRRNRQQDQKLAIEVWTEKDALSGILRRSTEKYHVQLVVNKGYTSSSAIYEAYQRIVEANDEGKPFIILYLGDHDPSGLDMVRDIRERLEFMLQNGHHAHNPYGLVVQAIGLTKKQVDKYKLPPNPAKMTDTRADKYIAQFGKICWEVDALRPQVLTALIEDSIEALIHMDQYKFIMSVEAEDKETLQQLIKSQSDEEEN